MSSLIKFTLFCSTVFILTGRSYAGAILADSDQPLLLEKTLTVGFAPPDRAGVYRFQVLKNGTLQSVDNQNNVTVKRVLDSKSLQNLMRQVSLLNANAQIQKPSSPPCFDAPDTNYYGFKTHIQTIEQKILLGRYSGCRIWPSTDKVAQALIKQIESLENDPQSESVNN